MGMFVDVHCHLDHPRFDHDREEVVRRAVKAGVSCIITNGIDPATNRRSLELAKSFPIVRPALGIYPIEALAQEVQQEQNTWRPAPFDVDEEVQFIREHRDAVVAIGEVGLDGVDPSSLDAQKAVFHKMIDLAQSMDKPLIVHSRKAEKEVIDMLEEHNAKKVVLHCFGGSRKLVERASALGYFFSVPCNVVRSGHFQMIVKIVPMNQLLTETDAPYLGPQRDVRNESANVVLAAHKIAEIKQVTQEECVKNLFMNFQRFFL